MKKVLVVGAGSYIGESFSRYASDRFEITTVGTMQDEWKSVSFSDYDSILHVAGIAHVAQKSNKRELYQKVNCDLAVAVAEKAKVEGVSQFVFLSSLYAFGKKTGAITTQTIPVANEDDCYGASKLAAEQKLLPMSDDSFRVVAARPPMVYGPNSKGNFPRLISLVSKISIFPKINNRRSMIYIDNLLEFFCLIIDKNCAGIFCPQNAEYVNTTKMIAEIANCLNKKVRFLPVLNLAVWLAYPMLPALRKIYGDLYYEQELSKVPFGEYRLVEFKTTIEKSLR